MMNVALWNRLFPFFIRIDRALQITEAGASLQKLIPDLIGKPLRQVGYIITPTSNQFTFAGIQDICEQTIIFQMRHKSLRYKGQVVLDSPDHLVLCLSLWPTDLEQVMEFGLADEDFAWHDPTFDLLQSANHGLVSRKKFLDAVSRGVRTPVGIITWLSTMLLKEDPKPEQIESLEKLQITARNLSVLISDALELDKIEAEQIYLERRTVDLPELIEGLCQTLSDTAKEKGLGIKVEIGKSVPRFVWTDELRLLQVLSRIVDDAVNVATQGNIFVNVQEQTPVNAKWTEVRFEIIDTGSIPIDRLKMMVRPSADGEGTVFREPEWIGLGLSIAIRLLEAMGTRMEVTQDDEHRLCIGFHLKLEIAEAPWAFLGGDPWTGLPIPSYRILVVDDNHLYVQLLRKVLRTWKIDVSGVRNGQDAIRKSQEREFDLIFMDIDMPDMDGYETVEQMKASVDPWIKEVPIIALLSPSAQIEETILKVKQAGMTDWLKKPFGAKALKKTLQTYLLPTT